MDNERRTRDEFIVLKCQAADPTGFEDLVAAFERPLFYYAAKLTGNPDRALDIVQEVWFKAFRGIRKLQDPAALRSWLYSITHGLAVDTLRREHSRERVEDLHLENFQEACPTPFDAADAAAVHQALDELDSRYREVMVLFFLEEFTIAEISQIAKCPEGTVKSRLFYARKELRQILVRGGYGKEKR